MILDLAFAAGGVLLLLLLSEYLQKTGQLKGEAARKFVHITVGAYVAFWPLFMATLGILVMCFGFVAVVLATRQKELFGSIHGVGRRTYGDIFFPLGIALTAVLADNPWIFTATILHLSLADGVAAVIGAKYAKRSYKVLGQTKTLLGSMSFFAVSLLITMWLVWFTPAGFGQTAPAIFILVPFIATVLENIAVFGMDNIVVPVTLTLLLNSLQVIA